MLSEGALKRISIPLYTRSHNYIYPDDFWDKCIKPQVNQYLKNDLPLFVLVGSEYSDEIIINKIAGKVIAATSDTKSLVIDILDIPLGRCVNELMDLGVEFVVYQSGSGNLEFSNDENSPPKILTEGYSLSGFTFMFK